MVVARPSNSFVQYDMFFACFTDEKAVTEYNIASLPFTNYDSVLLSLDLPAKITTSQDTFAFRFSDGTFSKSLSHCLNSVLSGFIDNACSTRDYPMHSITTAMTLEHVVIYVIMATGDAPTHIKIICTNLKQTNFNTPFDITVLAVSPACHLGISTAVGTVSVRGNTTYQPANSFSPRLLFGYDIKSQNAATFYHTILIIVLSVTVVLMIGALSAAALYICTKIETIESPTYNGYDSSDSNSTIQNMEFAPARPPAPTVRSVSFQ